MRGTVQCTTKLNPQNRKQNWKVRGQTNGQVNLIKQLESKSECERIKPMKRVNLKLANHPIKD